MENYLINPPKRRKPVFNPFETIRHSAYTQRTWRDSTSGRFGIRRASRRAKAAPTLWTGKRKAAKAKRHGSIMNAIVKKEKIDMNPLLLINKRRKAHRKSAKKAKVLIFNRKRKSAKRRSRKAAKRAVMVINPMHRAVRRSRRSMRRYHSNPMPFMPKGMMGDAGQLVLISASMFAGYKLGSFVMDQVSAKVPLMGKPIVRVAAQLALGYGVYRLAKKVKQIPAPVATALGAAVMFPAVVGAWDMVRGMLPVLGAPSAVPTPVAYGEELNAYVPEGTGAYVPETVSAGGYGSQY